MKDILKHPTVSSIIATIVGTVVATQIIAYTNKVNFLEAFILSINWLKNVFLSFLTYQVSLWVILFVLFIYILVKSIFIKYNNISNDNSILKHYKKDTIDNILWIFEWYETYDGKYSLTRDSPHPICPNCMNDLVLSNKSLNGYYSPYKTHLACDNCSFSKNFGNDFEEYNNKIKREIIRRVRTGDWKKS